MLRCLQAHLVDTHHILRGEGLEASDVAIAAGLACHGSEVLTLDAHLGEATLKTEGVEEEC